MLKQISISNNICKLFYKLVFIALPFVVIGIVYVITDPSKKLRTYKCYVFDYHMLNRGDVSTRVFLKNNEIYHYDSFVFGSSRSCAHTTRTWKRYLPAGSIPFSFGSWNEHIEGIYKKMQLIDRTQSKIKNAFIVIDVDRVFVQTPSKDLNPDHYLISGQSKYKYYISDFYHYVRDPVLIFTSIDYKIFGKKRNYMKGFVGKKAGYVDPITNDWGYEDDDKPVKKEDYERVKGKFYFRPSTQQYEKKKIDQYKTTVLNGMSDLLRKHNTNFVIVIAPLYNQLKFNPDDLALLQNIFGKQNIYDYSGINSITSNIYNYMTDVEHYRKSVGKLIFKDIYSTRSHGVGIHTQAIQSRSDLVSLK